MIINSGGCQTLFAFDIPPKVILHIRCCANDAAPFLHGSEGVRRLNFFVLIGDRSFDFRDHRFCHVAQPLTHLLVFSQYQQPCYRCGYGGCKNIGEGELRCQREAVNGKQLLLVQPVDKAVGFVNFCVPVTDCGDQIRCTILVVRVFVGIRRLTYQSKRRIVDFLIGQASSPTNQSAERQKPIVTISLG